MVVQVYNTVCVCAVSCSALRFPRHCTRYIRFVALRFCCPDVIIQLYIISPAVFIYLLIYLRLYLYISGCTYISLAILIYLRLYLYISGCTYISQAVLIYHRLYLYIYPAVFTYLWLYLYISCFKQFLHKQLPTVQLFGAIVVGVK